MSKVLILGGNGQLGHDLGIEFTNNNIDFISWSRSDLDILTDNIEEKLINIDADIIINCIAVTNVDGCEEATESAFLVNAVFASKLAKFCNKFQKILYHFSTDYVFDGKKNSPYTELDIPNPLSIYGVSKYAGELVIQNAHDKFFIFRTSSLFGVAGASGKGGNFITTMIRLGNERDSVGVIADQITCPTGTRDIARCVSYFILNKINSYGVYNCVSCNSCSWFEFAKNIFELAKIDTVKLKEVTFDSYSFKAARPKYQVLDTQKISKFYKMQTWEDSLVEYFNLTNSIKG